MTAMQSQTVTVTLSAVHDTPIRNYKCFEGVRIKLCAFCTSAVVGGDCLTLTPVTTTPPTVRTILFNHVVGSSRFWRTPWVSSRTVGRSYANCVG
jgi:hypothetical protein